MKSSQILENVKKIMKIKKISQKELAEMIDYSETGLHKSFKLEDIKLSTLLSIANALNVDPNLFFVDNGFDFETLDFETLAEKDKKNNELERLIIEKDKIIEEKNEIIKEKNEILEDQKFMISTLKMTSEFWEIVVAEKNKEA
ncbi:MAG: helix-turn-helix domain-containing protein [Bacteroidales bacterium]|jgi:transcriptional regulator with XRE-family HTH domain|nr:helix-turn-helix domain-containing protein [Bacteroidales bacterium]